MMDPIMERVERPLVSDTSCFLFMKEETGRV